MIFSAAIANAVKLYNNQQAIDLAKRYVLACEEHNEKPLKGNT
jgi:hypothetical protein